MWLLANMCSGNKLMIAALRPGTAYNFHLSAQNAVGYGKAVKFRVKTPRKEPAKEQAGAIKIFLASLCVENFSFIFPVLTHYFYAVITMNGIQMK